MKDEQLPKDIKALDERIKNLRKRIDLLKSLDTESVKINTLEIIALCFPFLLIALVLIK